MATLFTWVPGFRCKKLQKTSRVSRKGMDTRFVGGITHSLDMEALGWQLTTLLLSFCTKTLV